MNSGYYEESAVSLKAESEGKLYRIFFICAIVAFAVAVFILTFAFNYVFDMLALKQSGEADGIDLAVGFVTYGGTILLIAGAGVCFWLIKNRFNLCYDYTFVEDELRVSKAFNGKKRKFIKCFKADQILKLGKCESEGFRRTCMGLDRKSVVRLTPNKTPSEGKNFYYFLYTESLGKRVYILEARTELIDRLVLSAGREKWEAR